LFVVDANDFNWRLACVCIEDQYELWNKKNMKMKPILRKDIHYASVDAIHLMNVSIALSDVKIFYSVLVSSLLFPSWKPEVFDKYEVDGKYC
jgi:hypothetical protein